MTEGEFLGISSIDMAGYFLLFLYTQNRLADLVVKASASGAEYPRFESPLQWDCSGSSHTSDLEIGTPWQVPGVIGSALGLVGPVSVHCDWLR